MSKTRICLNCAHYEDSASGSPHFAPRCVKGLNPSLAHATTQQHIREQGGFEPDAMAAFCDSYLWVPPGYSKFKGYVLKKAAADPRFSTVDLPEKFIKFWEKGHRVRIRIERGISSRYHEYGYVGMSTGYQPAFLLMRNINARGSGVILCESDEITGVREWHQKSYRNYREGM